MLAYAARALHVKKCEITDRWAACFEYQTDLGLPRNLHIVCLDILKNAHPRL